MQQCVHAQEDKRCRQQACQGWPIPLCTCAHSAVLFHMLSAQLPDLPSRACCIFMYACSLEVPRPALTSSSSDDVFFGFAMDSPGARRDVTSPHLPPRAPIPAPSQIASRRTSAPAIRSFPVQAAPGVDAALSSAVLVAPVQALVHRRSTADSSELADDSSSGSESSDTSEDEDDDTISDAASQRSDAPVAAPVAPVLPAAAGRGHAIAGAEGLVFVPPHELIRHGEFSLGMQHLFRTKPRDV